MRIAAGLLLLSLFGVAYSFTVPISQQQSPLLLHHSHRSTTTTLGYLAGNDDDVVPHHSPMPEEKKKKTRQQQRPRRPIRRSFLHKLDRLLTELQGTHDHLRKHAFLSGNFAPVSKEHVSVPVEVVEGCLPENLDGAFLRNGPNPIRDRQKKRYHWFDGHAMLHTLMFKNGTATYTNQFIPSPRYSIEQEMGEEFFPNLAEYKGILGLLKLSIHSQLIKEKLDEQMTVAPPNTNIMMYKNKLYCLHEANLPIEVRMHPDGRLQYIGHETFEGQLDYPVSAHPLKDGEDLLFHGYTVDEQLINDHGTMKVGRFNSATSSIDTYLVPTPTKDHVSFAHSLVHTDNYIIVWDCSVHFCTDALFMGGSFFRNNQDHTLKFGLIPKNATNRDDVIWIDSGKAGAIVHPLHAWEEVVKEYEYGKLVSSRTVLKLWTPFCEDLDLDLDKSNTFHMLEYTIDPKGRTVDQELIDDSVSCEFAVMPSRSADSAPVPVPPLYSLLPLYPNTDGDVGPLTIEKTISTLSSTDRYGWTAIFGDQDDGHFTGFAKWDMVSRRLDSTVYYDYGEIGGEPIVVRTGDEVYIGSYVYNEAELQSYFNLYDGETNRQVCRLKMPSRVPFGFHGDFISGEELEQHFTFHEALDDGFHAQCPMQWIQFFIRDYILGQSHF